jgi:23S rRNA pseudouridine2605 synthase
MKKKRPERPEKPKRDSSGRKNSQRPQRKNRFGKEDTPQRKKRPSKARGNRKADSSPRKSNRADQEPYLRDEVRLNKYIAHSGLCSRRDADEYIAAGKVKINGKVVTELGTKVTKKDRVEVDGQKVSLEPFVYILLNKGKDTISTTDDEKDRNTVLDVIEDATGYRVYPVGR